MTHVAERSTMKPQVISILLLLLVTCCATMDDSRISETLKYGDEQECIALFRHNPGLVNYEMRGFMNQPWSITVAAMYGKTRTLQYLVARGADISSTDAEGYTALHEAAREGHLETAEYLLGQGVDVNLVKKTHMSLVEYGQLPVGEYGPSPLTAAALGKSFEMVNLLLKAGAHINGTPPEPLSSPLRAALSSDNKDMVELFLNKGADPTLAGADGKSVLDYATERYGSADPDMVTLIRQATANWKALHGNGGRR